MKTKTRLIQRIIWGVFVGFHIIETIVLLCAKDYSTGLLFPRMFVYYAAITEHIVNQGHLRLALLWQTAFVISGVFLLFLIPACILDIPKTIMHGIPARIVRWDMIILVLFSLIDMVGCALTVRAVYHPVFSIILDFLVMTLSIWSLLPTRSIMNSRSGTVKPVDG